MSETELLPCPFCGESAVHQNHSAKPGEYWHANSFIRCPKCRANGPVGSQDEAIVAWNRRAPSPALQQALAERDEARERTSKLLAERYDLDRRIHRQRVQLRENWELIEQRANFVYRYRFMKHIVDRSLEVAIKYHRSSHELQGQLARFTAALSAETEACAKVAVNYIFDNDLAPLHSNQAVAANVSQNIAAAIRQRQGERS